MIRKRAEVGETVSPFGVAGQATREGGAIATIADLNELEVQTEVSENSVAKLAANMPAAVKLQAYPDVTYKGRLRQIFPSADRAKAIVEVRVSILDADAAREARDDGQRDVPGTARAGDRGVRGHAGGPRDSRPETRRRGAGQSGRRCGWSPAAPPRGARWCSGPIASIRWK